MSQSIIGVLARSFSWRGLRNEAPFAEIEYRGRRGGRVWGERGPTPEPTTGLGERRKLPQRGPVPKTGFGAFRA